MLADTHAAAILPLTLRGIDQRPPMLDPGAIA
jgi:hypothetical protein